MSWISSRSALRLLALVLLVSLPVWVGNSYYINIASQILIWAILALALNLLVGYAGLTSLGHDGLFAIGGYAAAMLLAAFPVAHAAALECLRCWPCARRASAS